MKNLLNNGGFILRDLVDNIIQLTIEDIENYNFPLNKLLGIEVVYSGIKFEFIAHFTDNPNLLCFGSGSSSRSQKTSDGKLIKPPFFRRWSWYKYFDENFIAYADPMFYLDEEIILGWYVGDKDMWYLEIISLIIKKIARNINVANNNILFYGSSGGGFSSIELGTLIQDSKVLINNSQFNVLNYYPWASKKLFDVLKKSFIGMDDDEIWDAINFRLNCIDLFKKEKYVPSINYYVNVNSEIDINNHCMPFLNELLENPYFKHDFNIHFYHDNNGHNPLNTDKSIEIIKSFVKSNLYQDNTKFEGKSFKVKLPKGYYLKSHNSISDNFTTIILTELHNKDICEDIKKYIKNKKEKFNHEVLVKNFNIGDTKIWRVNIKKNSNYVHYWFERYDVPFHFYTLKANDAIDDVMRFLIESLTLKDVINVV